MSWHPPPLARKWKTDHHELIVRPDALSLASTLVRHFDEPFSRSASSLAAGFCPPGPDSGLGACPFGNFICTTFSVVPFISFAATRFVSYSSNQASRS